MNTLTLKSLPAFSLLLITFCLFVVIGHASAAKQQGLVLQVSEGDPKMWSLVLSVAETTMKYANKPMPVTVVVFGPGLKMLTMGSSVANKLEQLGDMGVTFAACGMTMKRLKMTEKDLYPHKNIKRVRGAVMEIARLHNAGWTYIRP